MEIKIVNLCNHEVVIKDSNGKFWKLDACEGEPHECRTPSPQPFTSVLSG